MTKPTYTDRLPRHGIADDARILWIDSELAERDGINVERLTAAYEEVGIRLAVGLPVELDGGVVECPGCCIQYNRDRENWQPSDLNVSGWQPLCRVCENTQLTEHRYSVLRRLAKYKTDPGLLTRPGRGIPSPSWNENKRNLQRSVQFQRSGNAKGSR